MLKFFIFNSNNKSGRRSKYKWPDTFLIESSGRRETPESIAEAKAREARKQARLVGSATDLDDEADFVDAEDSTKRLADLEQGSIDQDFIDDDELDDTFMDDHGKIFLSQTSMLFTNLNGACLP